MCVFMCVKCVCGCVFFHDVVLWFIKEDKMWKCLRVSAAAVVVGESVIEGGRGREE